jgi:hypothetical protein
VFPLNSQTQQVASEVNKNMYNTLLIYYVLGELPVFGVPLSLAVERSKCHDGVDIPLVVRDCIDHVQQIGEYLYLLHKQF